MTFEQNGSRAISKMIGRGRDLIKTPILRKDYTIYVVSASEVQNIPGPLKDHSDY
jgi:hypothetical protein